MARAISHRGPDDAGLWQEDGLVLGHRRLSIIDLSPEGHQPMVSASGRYVIVFNGEIYNFVELQQELAARGATFRGRSDTEIMLAAFDDWGVNRALQKMHGMFAFALWDRQSQTLHFARDRLGKKPLYVGWAGGALVFGSELKALRAQPDFVAEVNRDVLALYTRYACVPAPHSIYRGVWQLLPGCRLTLSARDIKPGIDLSGLMEPYWQLARVIDEAKAAPLHLSDHAAVDEFAALLSTCVRDRMMADVPLGAMLSGGIDSSTIVALMQAQNPRAVKTFTIGFQEAGFDEAADARAVAAHLGTEHHEMVVGPKEALHLIPRLSDIYDEPFADESQIPTFFVSQFARGDVTVALSGDGGDELLGGYARHVMGAAAWRKLGGMPRPLRALGARSIEAVDVATWDRWLPNRPRFGEQLYKGAALLRARDANDAYRAMISRWDKSVVLDAHELSTPLMEAAWQPQAKLSLSEKLMAADSISYLPNDILVKVDRASMAVGLEARAPLLDQRLFEWCWRLPLNQKIRDGKGKWLLRETLARHVPRTLFERPKQGFSVPIGAWLQGPLREWAAQLLDEKKLQEQGFFNVAMVRAAWDDLQRGQTQHVYRLWTILMFQAWRQRWL